MEKIELFVETKATKKILFYGRADSCNLYHVDNIEREEWQLILHFSKFVVLRLTLPFYPASLVQQILRQGIEVETFKIQQMDIDTLQELLDQNSKK